MNDVTVGMENLPNVFISKIDLYPIRSPSTNLIVRYRAQIKLCIYDHSPVRSWYARGDLADLKVKVVFRGLEAADALNDGLDSLYDYNPTLPGVVVLGHDSFSIEEELDGYTKFSTVIETSIPALSSLNVYAACFIDDFGFGNDLFDKFYGPLAAEKVLAGGRQNRQSGYFYYPETNEEYGGPVHGHQGTYMEGSEHKSQPHSTLRYVAEEDYKIRIPEFESNDIDLTPEDTPTGEAPAQYQPNFGVSRGPTDLTSNTSTSQSDTPEMVAVRTEIIANIFQQRPQAQNLLGEINFEIRDAIRRGLF
tara:strand:+ start:572 stop:1489 length:918 start_codon:yes stop_codon:yes gene_type:complete